jgi:hypothetical protein
MSKTSEEILKELTHAIDIEYIVCCRLLEEKYKFDRQYYNTRKELLESLKRIYENSSPR